MTSERDLLRRLVEVAKDYRVQQAIPDSHNDERDAVIAECERVVAGEQAEREWMLNLPEREREALARYRARLMRNGIPHFIEHEGGGVTPHTVACEFGWPEEGDPRATEEIELVYRVLLELVAEGKLVYRDHLLYPPPRSRQPWDDRWRGQEVIG